MSPTFTLPEPGKFVRCKWDDMELWLIQPSELGTLPDGTALVCIDGTIVIKGKDVINEDIRFGCIAYGFLRKKG